MLKYVFKIPSGLRIEVLQRCSDIQMIFYRLKIYFILYTIMFSMVMEQMIPNQSLQCCES